MKFMKLTIIIKEVESQENNHLIMKKKDQGSTQMLKLVIKKSKISIKLAKTTKKKKSIIKLKTRKFIIKTKRKEQEKK